ncbi:MAG: 1-aminocyclopropane-1-carboxylate deaminase/D-cysteine desulfhydrase [Pseudonocardiaceae bacterium]
MPVLDELSLRLPSEVVELHDDRLRQRKVRLLLKRDDLIHPELTGNKWRKLKYNLARAAEQGAPSLLTFGGAYSNHIRATAAAGHYLGFKTVGVIRGEEHVPLNESLAHAAAHGMTLTYMDRSTYRRKMDPEIIEGLQKRFGDFFLLPEGGSNADALDGCAEIVREIDEEFDLLCCPCGTGGTLAGVSAGLRDGQRALGFSVLKGGNFLCGEVSRLQRQRYGRPLDNWSIECSFHFGGFARCNAELTAFIDSFEDTHGLRLEWIYVAKMMYGIFALVDREVIGEGTTLVALITG